MPELPITNGFSVNHSLPQSNQVCTNWYVQPVTNGGLSQEQLIGTPGAIQLTTTGVVEQSNRGFHVKNDIAYVVNGDTLYSVDRTLNGSVETFGTTSLGTITGVGRVSMADNGQQLLIQVPGGDGFIFDEDAGTPFEEITDPDFRANGNPQHVAFLDGFFVLSTDEKKVINSALNDGLAYNAIDFFSAEADPDAIVAPIVSRNRLFICGTETIEVFQNIGGAGPGSPFQRIEGFVLPVGVKAAFSLSAHDEAFQFIGGGVNDSPQIYAVIGQEAIVFSNDAVDRVLAKLTPEQLEDAYGFSYNQQSADFGVFTFGGRTFAFNRASNKWSERSSRAVVNNTAIDQEWRASTLVTAYGRTLVADTIDGRIGEISLDHFAEYDNHIIRLVSTLPFSNEGDSFTVPDIELTMESGVGNPDTPDPQVRMSRSLDGKTFTPERSRAVGKAGESRKRQIWRRNGRVDRFEMFLFAFSAKCKAVIMKLEADIIGGAK